MIKSQLLRKSIPLFQNLPDKIYNNLDLSGFFLPVGLIRNLREKLEGELGHFVVSYKADIFNLNAKAEEHLCALVKGADLNKEQLQILKEYEKKVGSYGVTFVVYQRPLLLMKINKSALYKEYLKKGLL